MKRDVRVYLQDILDCIAKVDEYTAEMDETVFLQNSQVQDAVIRRVEIIGEAVKHIPKRLRDKYPSIPWRQIAGSRDVVIHDYPGVSLRDIWKIVRDDLPTLKLNVQHILGSLQESADDAG